MMLFLLPGCTPEHIDFDDNDAQSIEDETASDAYFSESEDITSVAVSSDNATDGRLIIVNDPRLTCAVVTIEVDATSNFLVPKGVLRIDFGNGCTDAQGNVRKGVISIAYRGRRFLPSSSITIALDGFEYNGVKIEGSRSVVNASTSTQAIPVIETSMVGGKITWPDGTSLSRDEQTTRELKPGAVAGQNQWLVTGSATGTNRSGVQYSMTITKQLVYQRACIVSSGLWIPSQGVKELIVNDKKISVDYGDGACDNKVTVTIRSRTKEISI